MYIENNDRLNADTFIRNCKRDIQRWTIIGHIIPLIIELEWTLLYSPDTTPDSACYSCVYSMPKGSRQKISCIFQAQKILSCKVKYIHIIIKSNLYRHSIIINIIIAIIIIVMNYRSQIQRNKVKHLFIESEISEKRRWNK